MSLSFWDEKRAEIKSLLDSSPIENFLQWEPIRATMYPPTVFGDGRMNPHTLKQGEWLYGSIPGFLGGKRVQFPHLKESRVGNPLPYFEYSANLIQQIAQITLMSRMIDLSKIHTVVEFGGGFGSFFRVFRELGYKQNYFIFDLPELCTIQRYYVGQHHFESPPFITSDEGQVPGNNTEGILFVSMFALAETDEQQRLRFLNRFENVFLSYCPSFENVVNNDEWFERYFSNTNHCIMKNFLGSMGRYVAKYPKSCGV